MPSIKYVQDTDWWGTLTANIQTNLFLNFPWTQPSSVGTNHGLINHAKRLENLHMLDKGLEEVTLDDLYLSYVRDS